MALKLLKKIRDLLSRNSQQDIVPGKAKIAHGLARDLRPINQPPIEAPRAGGRLKGRVESVNGHQQVYIEVEEDTEELLALTEDVMKTESTGIDPYNTGQFTTTGAWEHQKRR